MRNDAFDNGNLMEAPVPVPFTDHDEISHTKADPQCTVACQILSSPVYPVALEW